MVNQDGSPLERAIEVHQGLIKQDGDLIGQALELERVRLEAAKKASPPATQIISTPQTPVKGYEVRDVFRPLEALVLQGPASVGGAEPFRNLVFERISGAVRQIYTNSGYNDPGIISWYRKENRGWNNDLIYICNNCNAVQRKDNKEKLTTPAEHYLIHEAFSKAGVLMHLDTSGCSEVPPSAPKGTLAIPHAQDVTIPADRYGTIGIAGQNRLEEMKALQKSIGGEWHQTKTDGTGGCWNSLYLFCIYSEKAYSRQTGAEFKSPHVIEVFKIISLSLAENLCPAQPGYLSLMKGYVLPEAARLTEAAKVNLPEAAKLTEAAELRIKEHCQGLHNYEPPKK